MKSITTNLPGVAACLAIALPAYLLGKCCPLVGGPVFGILFGMAIAMAWHGKGSAAAGIGFTGKYILQIAVVLLGFGLDLAVILKTGVESLPIIVSTILVSLAVAYILHRAMKIPGNISTLVGVGSSICGGSAVAATAPVIKASDAEVAQAISVIFFFNVIAGVLFPILGRCIGMDTTAGDAFGVFAGTAVNDTSSVTAAAATWDQMWNLGAETLDKAVTVKLTRTLAIIPITLVLSFFVAKKTGGGSSFSLKRSFPMFILWFVVASIVTTVAIHFGTSLAVFDPLKAASKFLIIMAMAAIGLNTDLIKLVRTAGKPIILGAVCWVSITLVALGMQRALGIW